jgi:hypothetical protein
VSARDSKYLKLQNYHFSTLRRNPERAGRKKAAGHRPNGRSKGVLLVTQQLAGDDIDQVHAIACVALNRTKPGGVLFAFFRIREKGLNMETGNAAFEKNRTHEKY